ncbi:PREDICTED: exosome complex component RRP4-like [Amphimedon queenslandica]|nr:PREDICTED: exosome complex component RRP4-like [Amphimedon queenslandica]|eukprot:XP_019849816.1 PREDICTED: exosome complex component RRP4-like [Amphimedon queenslandica]
MALKGEPHYVAPGDVITANLGFMRGHGTYESDGKLLASVAGVVERVNRLLCVHPLKSKYNGEIGDVVVGRIIEVQQKRWKVETSSRLDSVLNLSSINLPGGVLRRRSAEDEVMIRDYLKEGDLISAEVQQVNSDGSLSLHTRSLKYGKLTEGTLVTVSPSLVKRCKNHFHNLLCGASLILGNNGYIWISPIILDDHQQEQMRFQLPSTPGSSSVKTVTHVATIEERETIARLRNCILALAQSRILLYDTTVQYAYDASLKYEVKE